MDKIGSEYRWVREDLDEDTIERRKRELARTYERQREMENDFVAFQKWASPRARSAFDPDYENEDLEGEDAPDIVEARAMNDEVDMRRKLRAARVGLLKAERRAHIDAIANGYEYRRVECELLADPDKPEVAYVDAATGEEVDRRAMTAQERQRLLPEMGGDEGNRAAEAVL